MKRTLIALVLAGFAAAALAQPSNDSASNSSSVWSQDHNFVAPAQ